MANLLQNNAGYLQQLQKYNLYTPSNVYDLNSSALVDAISSIINGAEGVNAGFSNSLAARILLPNTPIQQIGTIQLAKAIALRAASNLRDLVLPTLNITGTDISFRSPHYWDINNSSEDTSISGLLKTILDYTPRTNPIPTISLGPNKIITPEISNFNLRTQRGQGQSDAYNLNISLNDFQPYVLNTDDETKQYGTSSNLTQTAIILGTYSKSLLAVTNNIIAKSSLDNNGYQSLNSANPSADTINRATMAYANPEIVDSPIAGAQMTFGSGNLIARGDGTFTDDTQKVFLRSFNYQKPYQGTGDLMKFNQPNRANSVLSTVFPNIAPTSTDSHTVKNLMFSIENLAGQPGNPSDGCDTGLYGGRAMWFPPYGLEISESINTNWTTVDMLGRSEPIYTYNSRERLLNLSFTLIVDYPSQLNDTVWTTNSDNEYSKFFKQNNTLNKKIANGDSTAIAVAQVQNTPVQKTMPPVSVPNPFPKSSPLKLHFDNNLSAPVQHLNQDVNGKGQADNNNFFAQLPNLIAYLNSSNGSTFEVFIQGFASAAGTETANNTLSLSRAQNVYQLIAPQLTDKTNNLTSGQMSNNKFSLTANGDTNAVVSETASLNAQVVDRYVAVYLDVNPALITNPSVQDTTQKATQAATVQNQNSSVASNTTTGGNYKYFDRLKNDENKELVLQSYKNRIKYFSPVFHSQTPEDFNTRLTFLQQCTLQGNAIAGATNSVFGKPPVCVLRLGDFFNTKMIISSLNFAYEPLMWDMNPEGIGVQPMICNVTMECKILGGQSLAAPLTKLQNALSYHFYANTGLYDTNAQPKGTVSIGTITGKTLSN